MKRTLIFLVILSLQLSFSNAQEGDLPDDQSLIEKKTPELQIKGIQEALSQLERKLDIIDKTQLNYQIEKDLIRETYSSNFKTINSVISIALGIIAILGFIGIKDIGRIKEKYEDELRTLSDLKLDFERRAKNVEQDADKLNSTVTQLVQENQEQDRKIKFIELKDRMMALLKENNNVSALEFANLALELQPEDELCTNIKSLLLVRLNQLPEANNLLYQWLRKNPDSDSSRTNLVEQLYFSGDFEKADELIEEKKSAFIGKQFDGKLLEFLNLFKLYHNGNADELKQVITNSVTHENMKFRRANDTHWSFKEALHFIHYCPDSEQKTLLQHYLWYLDGQLSGEEMLNKLKIELPSPPEEETEA